MLAAGDQVRVSDTRKTLPGLRALEKAAVRAGGGVNHRGSLSDFVLVKDNHLAGHRDHRGGARARTTCGPAARSRSSATASSRWRRRSAPARRMVLLDNMTPDGGARVRGSRSTAPAVAMLVEVSGGVTLETVRAYADAGADLISTSVITQSAPALDIAFDLAIDGR